MPELVDPQQLRETTARPNVQKMSREQVSRLWAVSPELFPCQLSADTVSLAQEVGPTPPTLMLLTRMFWEPEPGLQGSMTGELFVRCAWHMLLGMEGVHHTVSLSSLNLLGALKLTSS